MVVAVPSGSSVTQRQLCLLAKEQAPDVFTANCSKYPTTLVNPQPTPTPTPSPSPVTPLPFPYSSVLSWNSQSQQPFQTIIQAPQLSQSQMAWTPQQQVFLQGQAQPLSSGTTSPSLGMPISWSSQQQASLFSQPVQQFTSATTSGKTMPLIQVSAPQLQTQLQVQNSQPPQLQVQNQVSQPLQVQVQNQGAQTQASQQSQQSSLLGLLSQSQGQVLVASPIPLQAPFPSITSQSVGQRQLTPSPLVQQLSTFQTPPQLSIPSLLSFPNSQYLVPQWVNPYSLASLRYFGQ